MLPFENPLKKPGPIFNFLSRRAEEEGCEYLYRVNDDTVLTSAWTSSFVSTLLSFEPPNVGVVGPFCDENRMILTHDLVHRTHHAIFGGCHYPPRFTDWWLDDWISSVYGYNRTAMLVDVKVKHNLTPSRYEVTQLNKQHLEHEVAGGQEAVDYYLNAHRRVEWSDRVGPES